MNRADALSDAIESPGDPADAIVNLRGSIQRNDRVVCMLRDFARESLKQQARRKNRYANPSPSQKIRECEQIRMHQGLAAREYHPPDLKALDRIHLRFELSQAELAMLVGLPDVAHHTTAVASAVRLNQQHR
jgi:hypothetical protein